MRLLDGGYFRLIISLMLVFGLLGCVSQEKAPASYEPPLNEIAKEGKAIILKNGCRGCHTIDGRTGRGPTWKGLYGSEVPLQGGDVVLADREYLRESIERPNRKIVKGYLPGIMPQDFGKKLFEDDIDKIIEYIMAVK
ncbi:MAG: cytochrome c [Candidatus Hydrothermarchaeales archaeon]